MIWTERQREAGEEAREDERRDAAREARDAEEEARRAEEGIVGCPVCGDDMTEGSDACAECLAAAGPDTVEEAAWEV